MSDYPRYYEYPTDLEWWYRVFREDGHPDWVDEDGNWFKSERFYSEEELVNEGFQVR